MQESEKWKWSRSVVYDPQWPHRLQASRLLRSWDFPGTSTRVGVPLHYLLLIISVIHHIWLPKKFQSRSQKQLWLCKYQGRNMVSILWCSGLGISKAVQILIHLVQGSSFFRNNVKDQTWILSIKLDELISLLSLTRTGLRIGISIANVFLHGQSPSIL